jgi:hypothetical protein
MPPRYGDRVIDIAGSRTMDMADGIRRLTR